MKLNPPLFLVTVHGVITEIDE